MAAGAVALIEFLGREVRPEFDASAHCRFLPDLNPSGKSVSAEVSLGIEEAKRLKNMSRAVVIVRFEEPYVGSGIVDRQLQVRLIDVYFFDQQTGKVLAKVSQSSK
jgi:hypothetical protein